MPFENRLRKDSTDQQQASSSSSESPDRLQKMRNRAYMFTTGEYDGGKSPMTPEMQMEQNQAQQEKWGNDHRESIQAFKDQRGGRTLPSSEIRLGYQEGLRGGAYDISLQNLRHVLREC